MDAVMRWTLLAFCLGLGACMQAPVAERVVEPDHPACTYRPALFVSQRIARQDAEIGLVAAEPVGAYAPHDIPQELLSGWSASPAGLVTLDAAKRSFRVLPTATPGADVTITAKYCAQALSRTIRIVGRDETVITGMWGQQSITCTGETPREPVRELDLGDTGDFSITYAPFESYKDFWGKMEFDPATGALTLTTTGGNRVPQAATLTGKASLTPEGKLVLDGFFLSQPERGGSQCRYVFSK